MYIYPKAAIKKPTENLVGSLQRIQGLKGLATLDKIAALTASQHLGSHAGPNSV